VESLSSEKDERKSASNQPNQSINQALENLGLCFLTLHFCRYLYLSLFSLLVIPLPLFQSSEVVATKL